MATTFVDLQNGFYNGFSQGLGFPVGYPFQLLQPSTPLPANNNQALWNFFNNIPPATVTSLVLSGGAQFMSNYSALISALVAPQNNFESDIGACYKPWITFVTGLTTPPAPNQLPGIFRNWALINCPTSANKGAADLSAMLLEPVSMAGLALMPYLNANGTLNPPNWDLGYATLIQQLANAESRTFTFSSSNMNSSLSQDWSQSNTSGLFGLWGGSSSSSSQSETFASGGVTITASFAHVLTFVATPGSWYTSSALGLAFANQSGPPWNPQSQINWQDTFSPTNGNLARFVANLIVADTMKVSATSTATFSQSDQQTIQNNSGSGMWPFYSSNSSSSSNTSVSFNSQGQLTTTITTAPGVPIVLGATVIPVSEFVGHAVEGQKIFEAAMASMRKK